VVFPISPLLSLSPWSSLSPRCFPYLPVAAASPISPMLFHVHCSSVLIHAFIYPYSVHDSVTRVLFILFIRYFIRYFIPESNIL
jgi:hypothetical protein